MVQTLPQVNWQAVVSQFTEDAPEDTISGLAAVVAMAITHRPQGVTSFVQHGGLGALARLVISTRCLAANRRTSLTLIALLLRETPSRTTPPLDCCGVLYVIFDELVLALFRAVLPRLTEHTPMITLIDATLRSGLSELQATGLAMLQELSSKTPGTSSTFPCPLQVSLDNRSIWNSSACGTGHVIDGADAARPLTNPAEECRPLRIPLPAVVGLGR